MKSKILLLSATSLFLAFASCKKDSTPAPVTPVVVKEANEILNDKISSGTWAVTSFTVNGSETVKTVFNSIDMVFKKEDKENGTSTWTLIDMSGATTKESDKYAIRNKGTELDLGGDILNITNNGNTLRIEGNLNGDYVIINAKK